MVGSVDALIYVEVLDFIVFWFFSSKNVRPKTDWKFVVSLLRIRREANIAVKLVGSG